jgi:predicted TIM-barrel fold metal-dependent hydrolase
MSSTSCSAKVRSNLKHPVVDADGHWRELQPVFLDYLAQVAGGKVADAYRKAAANTYGFNWYDMTPEERSRQRINRPPWWIMPTNTLYRATGMIPALFQERLDEFGIDYALLYPSLGFQLPRVSDESMRRACVRAYNTMVADMWGPYSKRIAASGVVAMNTPAEAIEEAEYAVKTLGLKLVVANCTVQRTIEADNDIADPKKRRIYVDGLGLDSPFDYDPVWRKFVELKVAVTSHVGSMGWPDRRSTSCWVSDHIGHFAQSHHLFARSMFLGGVTQRFPELNVGFLEGGVGWACQLYSDMFGHWEKRNKEACIRDLKPTNLDRKELRRLVDKYAADNVMLQKHIDDALEKNLDVLLTDTTQEFLTERDMDSDEFMHVKINSRDDIRRLFADPFYFGCEADDPVVSLAFNEKTGTRLKPMLGSDISHFDVPDPTEVLEEAWELVEHGLINEDNFREYTFANAVKLHGIMNPDFFKGTVVEKEAGAVLAGARAERKAA